MKLPKKLGIAFVLAAAPTILGLSAWQFQQWPFSNGSIPINICFIKQTAPGGVARTAAAWDQDKKDAAAALAKTWEAHSGIDFIFANQDCGSPGSDDMPITMVYDSNSPNTFGGFGCAGKGNRCSDCQGGKACQAQIGYGPNRLEFETEIVHEVGHALGLRHERTRPDCTPCTCVGGVACNAADRIRKCDPDEGGPVLTSRYDTESIMAWWECYENRVHDATPYYELSHWDKVGINVLYPKSLNRPNSGIGSTAGFYTKDGVLIRDDGSITTDWTALGAHPDVYKSALPTWTVSAGGANTYPPSGIEVNASYLKHGSNQVSFTYKDYWDRMNSGGGQAIKNSSLHTAVLVLTLDAPMN